MPQTTFASPGEADEGLNVGEDKSHKYHQKKKKKFSEFVTGTGKLCQPQEMTGL